MEKYEKLLFEGKFNKVEEEIKKLLDNDNNNSKLWYLLFLSQNNNYINFDKDNINNELAFNKALEYSKIKDETKLKYEFNLYSNLNIEGFDKLLRFYQYKLFDDCMRELYKLSDYKYNKTTINDDLYDALEYIFSNVNDIEEINIQLLILKFIYLITEDKRINNLIKDKCNSSLYKDKLIDFDEFKTIKDIKNLIMLGLEDEKNRNQKKGNSNNTSKTGDYVKEMFGKEFQKSFDMQMNFIKEMYGEEFNNYLEEQMKSINEVYGETKNAANITSTNISKSKSKNCQKYDYDFDDEDEYDDYDYDFDDKDEYDGDDYDYDFDDEDEYDGDDYDYDYDNEDEYDDDDY